MEAQQRQWSHRSIRHKACRSVQTAAKTFHDMCFAHRREVAFPHPNVFLRQVAMSHATSPCTRRTRSQPTRLLDDPVFAAPVR